MSGPFPENRYHIPGARRPIPAFSCRPHQPPLRRLLYVHGYGEHKETLNYRLFAAAMAGQGIEVHGFDLPGHGLDPAMPAAWDAMREDMQAAFDHVRPDAILGLSLGAVVALEWSISCQSTTPVITVGAPIGRIGVSRSTLVLGKVLSRMLPTLRLAPRLRKDRIARDLPLLEEYLTDPLFHQRATSRAVEVFFQTARFVRHNAGQLRAPLLMLHGADDRIALPHPDFLARAAGPRKREILYPGARHNLLLETNRTEVYTHIAEFLLQDPGD